MKNRLLAIGGPKSGEWLPWNGEHIYIIPVPVKLSGFDFSEPSPIQNVEIKTTRYFVWDMGDFAKDLTRKVYVHEDVSSSKEAENMLKNYLLEAFIDAGQEE